MNAITKPLNSENRVLTLSPFGKQAVAWILKAKTNDTGVWIADRLRMGHRVSASKAISRFRNSERAEVKKLKVKNDKVRPDHHPDLNK